MNHAEHFLSRLDRLAGREVDLALELYRDADLLRFVLGSVSLPDGAERVAISLDDPALGPFLIVTCDVPPPPPPGPRGGGKGAHLS